jgi:hypothetical protein
VNLEQAKQIVYDVKDKLNSTVHAAAVVATDCVARKNELGALLSSGINPEHLEQVMGMLETAASDAQLLVTNISAIQNQLEEV